MNCIETKVILFSRTKTEDYRWIFSDKEISVFDEIEMEKDFQIFQLKGYDSNKTNHLYVRILSNEKIAIYKFYETNKKDSADRKISALSGLFFPKKINEYLNSIVINCFFNLECCSLRLYDHYERIEKPFSFLVNENRSDSSLSDYLKTYMENNSLEYGFSIIEENHAFKILPLSRTRNEETEENNSTQESKENYDISTFQKKEESDEPTETPTNKGFLNFIRKIFK